LIQQLIKETKNLSVNQIGKILGISRPTIYRIFKDYLGYISNRLVKSFQKLLTDNSIQEFEHN